MSDEELQRVISEIDSALEILRRNRERETDRDDTRIRELLADLRRELAVYRAVAETATRDRRT